MIRKLLAASVAAGLAAVALPALPAFAAVASSAQLTSAPTVFPGDRTFSISVKNTEAALIGGPNINGVRINFPVGEAGVTLASTAPTGLAPAGFTATATNLGSTQFITYRGGAIAPGAAVTFTFPAKVLRPQTADLRGAFVVQTTDDNFATNKNAAVPAGATLTAAVEVLEIIGGSAKPTAPTNADNTKGVTDRSGTAGQTVTYAYQVRNYAAQDLLVTPSITSADPSDAPVAAAAVTVPTGETVKDVNVQVKLGTALPGGQRTTAFTARAVSARADAATVNDNFTVQAPVTLLGSNLQPVRTKSSPKAADSSRTFTLDLAKTGVQAFTLDSSKLSFAGNSANATTPVEYIGGNGTKNLSYKFTTVTGADGAAAATLDNVGTDNNLSGVIANLSLGNITIDNLAPKVSVEAFLPTDTDGDQQVASSNNDSILVKGTIENEKDLNPLSLKVSIVPVGAAAKPVAVTTTTDANTGTVTFTGTYNTATWEPGVTAFTAFALVEDIATNLGSASTASIPVDVALPVLANPGVVSTPTTIDVTFVDPSGIRGGCDARAYLIDGLPGQVTEVRNGDGGVCVPKALDFTGRRMLVLGSPLAPTDTPDVTYSLNRTVLPLPAKDGAGNDALTQTIETVTNVVPITPILVNVERRDGTGFELAYRDADEGGRYFSNATAADGNRLTVSGVRNGYVIQVRDAAGNVLATADPADQPATPLNGSPSYNGTVNLPTGTANAAYDRFVFFVSSRGVASKLGLPLTMVIDTVSPGLGAVTVTGAGTATQKFSEKVVSGSDVSDNWFTTYTVNTENGTAERSINIDSVTTVDLLTRSLVFTPLEGGTFKRTDYLRQSGTRYEDRAGNLIGDTLTPVV